MFLSIHSYHSELGFYFLFDWVFMSLIRMDMEVIFWEITRIAKLVQNQLTVFRPTNKLPDRRSYHGPSVLSKIIIFHKTPNRS